MFEKPFENINSKTKRPAYVAGDRSPNTGTIQKLKTKFTIETASEQDFDSKSVPNKPAFKYVMKSSLQTDKSSLNNKMKKVKTPKGIVS